MLNVENLSVSKGKIPLTDMNVSFEAGRIYTILGRTGAGKTELLRALIGVQETDGGRITLDDDTLSDKPVHARQMALVYQQFINYPHLNVRDNVAFPLRRQKIPAPEARAQADKALALVGLQGFETRRPAQLSGGQQQRVALARAIAKKARILLLDEPLANLDYKLREQLREEFPNLLHDNDDSVILYTTTEPQEAMQLGDRIIVMDGGRIVANGVPGDIFDHPPNLATARVISDPPISFVEGRVKGGVLYFATGEAVHDTGLILPGDGALTIGLRPDAIAPGGPVTGVVTLAEFSGSETIVHLRFDFGEVVMLLDGIQTYPAHSRIEVSVVPDHLLLFAPDGRNITKRSRANG